MNRRIQLNNENDAQARESVDTKVGKIHDDRSSSWEKGSAEKNKSGGFLHNPYLNNSIGEIATPQSRLIALLIDALIFGFGFGVVWLIWFAYLAERGTTPGHHLMGQVIVDAHSGQRFGWKKMVIREILIKGVAHWILGSFLFMANYIVDGAFILNRNQRTLHDLLIGSQVIQVSDKTIINKVKIDQVEDWLNK